ncbi:amidohydrolase family protein [Acidobacteriota bacterium]
MKKAIFIFCILPFLILSLLYAHQTEDKDLIALVGGTLIDGMGNHPLLDSVVLISGSKIRAVGAKNSLKIPKDAKAIDVSGKWILPGFIDCHTHITYDDNYGNHSLAAFRGLRILRKYLKAGVTTVRDVGGPIEPLRTLKSSFIMGFDASRLYACGQLITATGSYNDIPPFSRPSDGPWDFRKAVREMFQAGFHAVKISPWYTREEIRAAVEEAKAQGMIVVCHSGGTSDTVPPTMTRIAVEEGVDCIEHLSEMEDEVLDIMAKKGIYNVPTLLIMKKLYEANMVSRFLVEERGWSTAMHEELFKKARARDIVMGVGTDFIWKFMELYPGGFFDEMRYYLELGASPMEVLVCATKNGALILGKEDKLGTIETGKIADIQVLDSNPLESFDGLGHPEIVMLGGKVYRNK